MKKVLVLAATVVFVGFFVFLSFINVSAQRKATFPFYVYKDKLNRGNHYCPSGWMGDYAAIKINDNWKENPYEGKTCIKWSYSGEPTQGAGWAGVFWQSPPNNWGSIPGGYDLTGAKKITFYAKGETGDEIVEFKIGGIMGDYSDTTERTTGPVNLTIEWKRYSIEDLDQEDITSIIGGFCWVVAGVDVPENGITFYLDEIVYHAE